MKIICVGRNYIDHAKELNNPIPEKPVLFLKPETALLPNNARFYYPDFSNEIHYEAELVLKICKQGKYIGEEFANRYYDAVSVGIDFTARDLQNECKAKGLPWEIAKAFDHSAVCGEWKPFTEAEQNGVIPFSLKLNSNIVQTGNSGQMMFSFDSLIAYISQYFTLKKGDLIFTGTPAGVGKVQKGDLLEGFLNEKKVLSCSIT